MNSLICGHSSRIHTVRIRTTTDRKTAGDMWTFLGLFLMVPMISGDGTSTTVYGRMQESVLLPCYCSNDALKQEFYWQKEHADKDKTKSIIDYKEVPNITDTYKGRVTLFQDESNANCSMQLHNITVDDEGTYRCSDMSNGYHYYLVHLNISETPSISSSKVIFKLKRKENSPPYRLRICFMIPIGLAVAVCLFLFRRWKAERQNMGRTALLNI